MMPTNVRLSYTGENELGYIQTYSTESGLPECSQCGAAVMLNRGQGTICDTCAHEALIEMALDYDDN